MLHTTIKDEAHKSGTPIGTVAADEVRLPSVIPSGCADFLARAAHDLRSPLGVLAEALPTLQHDLAEHLSAEHKTLLKLAGRSLFRLRTFVERLRLLSDLELSRLAPVPNPTPLGPLVQDTVDTMLTNEPRRGVIVSLDLGLTGYSVNADACHLSHALSELLSNAMRHATSKVLVSVENVAGEIRVVVEDDGPGLSDAEERLLFHRFVWRPSRNGLGTGVSLARALVAAQGGELCYEKREQAHHPSAAVRHTGTGTRFVISLGELRDTA